MIACHKEESQSSPIIEEPEIEALVQTGDYHFQSAEYLDNQGTVVAKGYDSFHVEFDEEGGYVITGLLYSSVRWDAYYDKERTQLILPGTGWKSDSAGNWSNLEGGCWFSILTNRGILSTDPSTNVEQYGLYGLFSFTSREAYHDPQGNPQIPCCINVDPETGELISFATLLSCECWACDPSDTSQPREYAGTKGYALPGTPIATGVAEKEYIENEPEE